VSMLTLRSTNGSPTVQWRDIDGHPVPYMVTIERRVLTPEGEEYRDGSSDWETVLISDVLEQLRLRGPVAEWLREQTRVDCSPARFAAYSDTGALVCL